jgi:hypothetical protein
VVVDVVRIKSDGKGIRFFVAASNNRPATQSLFSRTLPEGEERIKQRDRNTTIIFGDRDLRSPKPFGKFTQRIYGGGNHNRRPSQDFVGCL